MITQKQFEESLKILSKCQETYDTKEAPANVERIIFPRKEFIGDAKILLKYFYQEEGDNKTKQYREHNSKLIPNMVPIYIPWKLQDYVKFIRTKRDEMFPNDYKKKSRKFISHFGYYRSTLLSQYEKDLYGK